MIGEKPWYHSKTVLGSLVAFVASVGASAGLTLNADVQSQLVEAIVQLFGAAGALFAIYGRFVADETIR